jgi:predicted nucleotidyltransferase
MIEETIKSKLKEIEERENLRILYAVESGSRAWGFASPDSDYDVRFIYVRKPEVYLALEDCRDVIEWQLDAVLDINGWDLRKTLRLLYNSNPTLFEWANSSIVYKITPEWREISAVFKNYFLSKSGIYHYLHMAEGNYREYLKGDTIKVKKYFYVLRPILACEWILKNASPPPVLFSELVESHADDALKSQIDRLFEIKIKSPETELMPKIKALNDFIERKLPELKAEAEAVGEEGRKDYTELNRLFLRTLYPYKKELKE